MIRSPQKIKMIKLDEISPNPYQVRRNFSAKSLQLLASSIKEVGILSPVIVRTSINGYELICGQRRIRAAIIAGLSEVPAVIVRAGDRQCAQLSMIENLQRDNISVFEEAEGYYNLMSYHRVKKDELIKNLSLESGRINEKVRLLSLGASVRYKIEENNVSEAVSRELLKLHNEEKQNEILEKAVKEELNKTEVSLLVKQALREMTQKKNEEKRGRKNFLNMPLCINTVKKTVDLLKKSGANVEMNQKENENFVEFTLKINK